MILEIRYFCDIHGKFFEITNNFASGSPLFMKYEATKIIQVGDYTTFLR